MQPKEKLYWRGVEREGESERGSVGPYSDRRKVASQIPLQLPKGPGFLKSGAFLWGTYDQDYCILGHYGRAVSVIVLEDSKTPLGRKHIC